LEGSDLSTLKQDDRYTRFEKLFMEFFGSPASFGIVIEPDEFRPLFYHSWEREVLPSKEILVKAVQIKPTSLVSLEEIGDHVLSTFALALEKLNIEEHNQDEKNGKESIVKFPSPPDLCWEEVSIVFISDTEIKVRARDQMKKYRFDHIGFKNKKSSKPNILWWFLRALAEKGGELSWDNSGSHESPLNPNQVQSNVKRLRKTLCKFMDIEDDPFHPYRKVKAYKAKFNISGNVDTLLEPDNDGSESDLLLFPLLLLRDDASFERRTIPANLQETLAQGAEDGVVAINDGSDSSKN